MATSNKSKITVTNWGLIGILFITAVFGMVFFSPMAYAAEEFDTTGCYSGTVTMLHRSKELSPVMTLISNGIIMSNSENKFLDNTTFHCEAVRRIVGKKMDTHGYCKYIDPDGDIIIVEITGTERKFLEGTGKYKGITGSFRPQPLARGKAVMPGNFHGCLKGKGTVELPPK